MLRGGCRKLVGDGKIVGWIVVGKGVGLEGRGVGQEGRLQGRRVDMKA